MPLKGGDGNDFRKNLRKFNVWVLWLVSWVFVRRVACGGRCCESGLYAMSVRYSGN